MQLINQRKEKMMTSQNKKTNAIKKTTQNEKKKQGDQFCA